MVTEARKRTADLDTVDRGDHQASGPVRTKHAVALQATGEVTAKIKNSFGILPFQSVADGIFTQTANAFVESTFLTFRFDSVQSRKLASGSQKDGIKDLLSVVPWGLAEVGQRAHLGGEIKDLIEIRLELVPAQGLTLLFFLPLTLEKTAQIDLADGGGGLLETSMQLHLATRLFGQLRGDVKGLQLAVQEDGNLEYDVQPFAMGTVTRRLSAFAPALDEGTGQHLA
jgi:hypothetical protein